METSLMKLRLFTIAFLAAWASFAQQYTFDIRQNHLDGVYNPGERIVFTCKLFEDGKPAKDKILHCIVHHNKKAIKTYDFAAGKPVQVATSMDKPGYCHITAVAKDKNKKMLYHKVKGRKRPALAYSGAVVNPLDIRQGTPEPKDFDAFWNAEKKRLKNIPMNVKLKLSPDSKPYRKVYLVTVNIGPEFRPVQGVMHIPTGVKPKSLPIFLFVHGAGVHMPKKNKQWAPPLPRESGLKPPVIFMDLNAHGLPNDKPAGFYLEKRKGELKNYPFMNNGDKEKYYMKGMIL